MKRVEIYGNQFNVIGPGGQHRSLMVARGLAKHYGYEVYLVTPRFRARYEDVVARPQYFLDLQVFAGSVVVRIKSYLANGLALPIRAATEVPAIVVLPSPIFRANVSVVKKLKGQLVVFDFGDVWYSPRDPRLYKVLSTWYLAAVVDRFVDYLVMPTRALAEFARRLMPERLRDKVLHIPSSIDTDVIRPARKSDRPRVAYVGSLVGRGIEMLPYIAREVARRCGGAEFVVVGEGPLKAWLEHKAADLGLGKAFTFVGGVEFERLPEVCGDCWIGLSLVRESTIYPVDVLKSLLYMALAMPIVSSIYIEEAENVMIKVPPTAGSFAETICKLIKDDTLRGELSARARARAVNAYDIRHIAGKYYSLLRRTNNKVKT